MLGCVVALTLWMLAAKGTQWHVYLSVWISWGFALALVALVPIDIHIVYLKRCIEHYGNNTVAQVASRLCPRFSFLRACVRLRAGEERVREEGNNVARSYLFLPVTPPPPFFAPSSPPLSLYVGGGVLGEFVARYCGQGPLRQRGVHVCVRVYREEGDVGRGKG